MRKVVERFKNHPDIYRLCCGPCGEMFEDQDEDFRYEGGYTLSCTCPWCNKRVYRHIRELKKAKIHYEASYTYVD